MPEASFDRCYRCNYSLKGLPAEHRCPECGEAYDESVRIWRAGKSPLWPAGLFLLVMLHCSWGFVIAALWRGGRPPAIHSFYAAFFTVGAVMFGLAARRLRRCGPIAAITQQGVFVRNGSSGGTLVPWAAIAEVRLRADMVLLVGPNRSERLSVPVHLFSKKSRDDAEAFAAAVRQAKSTFDPGAGMHAASAAVERRRALGNAMEHGERA